MLEYTPGAEQARGRVDTGRHLLCGREAFVIIHRQVGSCEGELRKFLFTSTYLLSDREGKVISNIK